VEVVRVRPVPSWSTVTVTLGSAPPCVSVTVPEMRPLVLWAHTVPVSATMASETQGALARLLRMVILLQPAP
jgi:hypothetical protein